LPPRAYSRSPFPSPSSWYDKVSQGAISYSQLNHDHMINLLPKDRYVNWSTMAIAANQLPGVTYVCSRRQCPRGHGG
jgi:hypothetical protein